MPVTALGMPSAPISTAQRPDSPALIDSYGRVATDLRVSVTDHCNLRCTYCMPAEGVEWLPREDLLSTAELQRLLHIAVTHLGIAEIRFTGGEPLLRRDLPELISFAAALRPRPDLSITTNGLGLKHKAKVLAEAGLNRINVSLDSVDRAAYATITRRDRLHDVLDGLSAAVAVGLTPVKVNAVLQRGINERQAADLLDFCLASGYELRFIEQMPLDADHRWDRASMITAGEILDRLQQRFILTPDATPRGAAPAQRWLVDGGPASVGVIASVTKPFCGDCDRVRLTADGQLRNCLFATGETDLRGLLRAGGDDLAIGQQWRSAIWAKKAGHGINAAGFQQPARPMSAIGG